MIDILLAVAVGTLSIVMAVIGGVTATQNKTLRLSFVVMGALSVAFVIFQAVRATNGQNDLADKVAQLGQAQGKLSKAQGDLAEAQAELRGLTTGGEAYPSLYVMGEVDNSGAPQSALIFLENHDKTRSLYSLSVEDYLGMKGEPCCDKGPSERPTIQEIAPGGRVQIPGDFYFKDPVEAYKLNIRARNGEFVAVVKWTGHEWISTVKRSDSDTVLERREGTTVTHIELN